MIPFLPIEVIPLLYGSGPYEVKGITYQLVGLGPADFFSIKLML